MTDYPYIRTTGKLKEFLQKIPSMGEPISVSTRWLPKVGFKSANHRPIVRILDFIGFVDSNKPTDKWRAYCVTSKSRRVLAEGISEGYAELFRFYPDACQRSDTELKDFFQSHLSASDQVINSTVGTFKTLCSLADFKRTRGKDAAAKKTPSVPRQREHEAKVSIEPVTAPSPAPPQENPSVHIDLQIHIHPDADADQIREIFKNMALYLYNKELD